MPPGTGPGPGAPAGCPRPELPALLQFPDDGGEEGPGDEVAVLAIPRHQHGIADHVDEAWQAAAALVNGARQLGPEDQGLIEGGLPQAVIDVLCVSCESSGIR